MSAIQATTRATAVLLAAWAGAALAASISLQKGPVILGQDQEVGVTLRVDEIKGTEDLPLMLEVNVGSFGPVSRVGPGVFKTTYRLPKTLFPQVALVAAWRETGPEAPVDFLRIPLYGVTYVPVKAKPGAEVSVQAGMDPTPPTTVGRSGRVEVEVAVPPGVNQATISMRERKNGPLVQRQVPIEVPPYNRLTAALVPKAILADGESWARLELFYDQPGALLEPGEIKIQSSIGSASHEGLRAGRHVYRYQPPADTTQPEVKFQISILADPVAQAVAKLSLRLPPPARVVVRPPAEAIVADGKGAAEVVVQVYAASGLTLPRQEVELTANGERVGAPRYRGDGRYAFAYLAPAKWPKNGEIAFKAAIRGRPEIAGESKYHVEPAAVPAGMTARFTPDPVPADGRTEAEVIFEVSDAAGRPLKGAQLAFQAAAGKLSVVEDLGDGHYRARYTAPERVDGEPVLTVRDVSGQFEKKLPLPLREAPKHFLVGIRAGATHSLGDLLGPRVGLDLLVPIRLGGVWLLAGVVASGGRATMEVADPALGLSSTSTALFGPASVRLGYELFAGRNLSVSIGAGGAVTAARFTTTLTGEIRHAYALGGLGYLELGYALGPGHLFFEVSYTYAPVKAGDFVLEAGGVGAELGYRFGL
jgi:hypothetical protein